MTDEQTKTRRGATPASRRTRGVTRRGLKKAPTAARRDVPLTVFIHIPKTAGTTLTSVLRANFPPGTVRVIGNVFHGAGKGVSRGPLERIRRSGHVLTRDIHLLGGHIPFTVRDSLAPDTRYITFLRDPVERTLSHYYRILSMHRAKPMPGLPADPSLEQMLEEREYLFDNLQTRMLSGARDPFGKVTPKMLEQAKENLSTAFATFGLADRFDESLVLLKRALGLRSILYVTQRMTTARPRTAESKEEMIPIAERFNVHDLELYRWAAKRFDETVAEQDADFAVDLAALQAAVSNGATMASPPPADTFDRKQLWEELVKARAELLGWEFDYAKTEEKDTLEAVEDLRGMLQEIGDHVGGLEEKLAAAADSLPAGGPTSNGGETEGRGRRRGAGGRGRSRGLHLARARERKEAHLEDLRGQIEELEDAVGAAQGGDSDPHVLRELERLRALAAEDEEELRHQDERLLELEGQEVSRRRSALERKREAAAGPVERAEKRIEALRAQLGSLTGDDAESIKPRRKARLAKAEALLAEKEKELEQAREHLAAVEQELSELEDEAAVASDGS